MRTTSVEKKQLNTPIQANILDEFRTSCKEYGLGMNIILEALLADFSAGNYDILISKNDGVKVIKK